MCTKKSYIKIVFLFFIPSIALFSNATSYIQESTPDNGNIDKSEKVKDYILYPNPNNGQFQILFTDFSSISVQIELYNALGQKIYEENSIIPSDIFIKSFDFSKLPPSNYHFFVIDHSGKIQHTSFIIDQSF